MFFARSGECVISIYQIRGNTNDKTRWNDRKIYNQNIISTYVDVVDYMKKFIPFPFELDEDGITRKEMVPSYITIREAVANLLMHRDYFDNGIAAIRIYDDKIQLRNPGASLLSIDQIISEAETVPRNPVIARLFRLVGWAEIAGTGMLRMMENWQKAGFGKPVIRNNEPRYWFTIEFFTGEKSTQETTEKTVIKTVVKILQLVRENPKITIKQLAEETGLSRRGIEWNLDKLKKENKIKRIGPAKGGRWEIVEA